MKRIITISVLLVALSAAGYASNYEEAMSSNIEKMYQSNSPEELAKIAGQFSWIANAEKDKWLPCYYAAFSYLRATYFGNMNAEEIQKYLDLAQAEIDKVLKITSKESEVYALQAHVYQLRITDMTKGMKYAPLAMESLAIAERLNAKNPRVYYLKGANLYHTPEAYGGGAEKAKPLLEKAAEMFKNFQPENALMPTWGAEHNSELLSECK